MTKPPPVHRKAAQPPRKPAPRGSSNGVFDLNAVADEATREPFTFRLGAHTFTLPHFADLDPRLVARYGEVLHLLSRGELSDADAMGLMPFMMEALESCLGERFADFMATPMTGTQFNALFAAWQRHAGLEPGESGASPGS